MKTEIKKTLLFAFFLLLLLGLLKPLAPFIPYGFDLFAAAVLCFQLYLPLWYIQQYKQSYRSYGLYDYKLFKSGDQTDKKALYADIIKTGVCVLFVLFPYVLLHHLYLQAIALNKVYMLKFELILPENPFRFLLINVFIVALPEEVFYRGFIQSRLLKAWPNHYFFLGLPLGRAIIVTSLFFATAHFVGDFSFVRLLTFFPGLIFSALTYYSNAIWGTILIHALCNLLSHVLHHSYYWS